MVGWVLTKINQAPSRPVLLIIWTYDLAWQFRYERATYQGCLDSSLRQDVGDLPFCLPDSEGGI